MTGEDRRKCRQALGLGGNSAVSVNMYIYNDTCRSVPMAPFHTGIWNHEGYGTRSQTDTALANGHEARNRLAAGFAENDPYREVERLLAADPQLILDVATNLIGGIDARIHAIGDNHAKVRDNWCGSLWVWNSSSGEYVFAPIRQLGGACI